MQKGPALVDKNIAFDRVVVGSKGWRSGENAHFSHQCGLGSYPGVNAKCGLSLLLVLSFAPRGFFSGYSSKTNISKFQFDQESGRRRTTLWVCYLQIIIIIIIK